MQSCILLRRQRSPGLARQLADSGRGPRDVAGAAAVTRKRRSILSDRRHRPDPAPARPRTVRKGREPLQIDAGARRRTRLETALWAVWGPFLRMRPVVSPPSSGRALSLRWPPWRRTRAESGDSVRRTCSNYPRRTTAVGGAPSSPRVDRLILTDPAQGVGAGVGL